MPIRSDPEDDDEDEADQPINPHSLRANFSLYSYDRLLFCDECQQIRCPRCWAEETTHWYCPSCLFEVPSSVVKSDGNRCTRNCYNCPICAAFLVINGLDQEPNPTAQPADPTASGGPFILACPYCEWSSLDSGIELSRSNKITEQLYRLRRPTASKNSEAAIAPSDQPAQTSPDPAEDRLPEHAFARLLKFYDTQLHESDAAPDNPFALDASYSSPSTLHRIMNLYGGLTAASLKRSREKQQPMREALIASEGLSVLSPDADDEIIARLRQANMSDLTTFEQRASHPWNHNARFTSDLWPVPALLKTKKSKRCRACRHILIRHEDRKPASGSSSSNTATSMKYKIRLLAQNNIPRLSIRPFSNTGSVTKDHHRPSFALTSTALQSIQDAAKDNFTLHPGQTKQFLLLATNPLFETVHLTLATPAIIPGRIQTRVTILCPTFDLGPDGDMWDSALDSSGATTTTSSSTPRSAGKNNTTLAGGPGQFSERSGEERLPEAGKVWERGRNWAAVVLEVAVPVTSPTDSTVEPVPEDEDYDEFVARTRKLKLERTVDDDVLEIPVLVRATWDADVVGGEGVATQSRGVAARETRELEFWCVLGAGKIVES